MKGKNYMENLKDIETRENKRKSLEELLKSIPEGERISLPLEQLEELLFEEVVINDAEGIRVKIPVWSGEFLRKLDLSGVDFTNVSWDLFYVFQQFDKMFVSCFNKEMLDLRNLAATNQDPWGFELATKFKKVGELACTRGRSKKVNYSGTNAKIDFSKSFEMLQLHRIRITGCDFSGCSEISSLDSEELFAFLEENCPYYLSLVDCDFSNSSLKLKGPINVPYIYNCSFTNCDLSECQISEDYLSSQGYSRFAGTRVMVKKKEEVCGTPQ